MKFILKPKLSITFNILINKVAYAEYLNTEGLTKYLLNILMTTNNIDTG